MRLQALLFALSLSATVGCEKHVVYFSGTAPPSEENQALCRAVCEKAVCKGAALGACLSDCKRSRDHTLNCEYPWSRKLSCQRQAADLVCDEGGGVYAPSAQSCLEESQRYIRCMQVE